MKDWGWRIASGLRRPAAISSLVYDALRKKSSSAGSWRGVPAAEVGAPRQTRRLDAEAIAALFWRGPCASGADGSGAWRLPPRNLAGAPPYVVGDFSEWLRASSRRVSRQGRGRGQALRAVAVDLRANLLRRRATRRSPRFRISSPSRRRIPGRSADRDPSRRAGAAARVRPRPMSKASSKCRTRAATRSARGGSQAGHAGSGPLRRRGRQDAGACRRDGEPGPDLRLRPRPATGSRRSSPGSPARARATSRCGRREAARTCSPTSGAVRSHHDRRAVHRIRRLAAQPGRQVAHPLGGAGAARQKSGRNA